MYVCVYSVCEQGRSLIYSTTPHVADFIMILYLLEIWHNSLDYLIFCMFICEHVHVILCVEVREQLVWIGLLLVPCESRGSSSDAWWQEPLPTEQSHQQINMIASCCFSSSDITENCLCEVFGCNIFLNMSVLKYVSKAARTIGHACLSL